MQATTTANPAGSVTARFSGLPKELKVKIVAMAQENDLDWTRSPYVKWCEPELSSYETWRSMASRDSIKALLSVNKELNDLAAEHYFSVYNQASDASGWSRFPQRFKHHIRCGSITGMCNRASRIDVVETLFLLGSLARPLQVIHFNGRDLEEIDTVLSSPSISLAATLFRNLAAHITSLTLDEPIKNSNAPKILDPFTALTNLTILFGDNLIHLSFLKSVLSKNRLKYLSIGLAGQLVLDSQEFAEGLDCLSSLRVGETTWGSYRDSEWNFIRSLAQNFDQLHLTLHPTYLDDLLTHANQSFLFPRLNTLELNWERHNDDRDGDLDRQARDVGTISPVMDLFAPACPVRCLHIRFPDHFDIGDGLPPCILRFPTLRQIVVAFWWGSLMDAWNSDGDLQEKAATAIQQCKAKNIDLVFRSYYTICQIERTTQLLSP